MEEAIVVIGVLVGAGFVVKTSMLSVRGRIALALICALAVGLVWPVAVELGGKSVDGWLSNQEIVRDMAVLIFMDVAVNVYYCFFSSGKNGLELYPLWNRIIYRAVSSYPGIMPFVSLFVLLAWCESKSAGTDFALMAWCMAAMVGVTIPILAAMVQKIVPELDTRLESLFMLNFMLAIAAVLATVSVL